MLVFDECGHECEFAVECLRVCVRVCGYVAVRLSVCCTYAWVFAAVCNVCAFVRL